MLIRFFFLLFFSTLPSAWAGAADPVVLLRKLIISDTEPKAAALSADSGGNVNVFIQDVPVLADGGFATGLQKFFGQPITPQSLNGLAVAIDQYAKSHDRLIVKVMAPVQNASDGVIRLAVVVGRYKDIKVQGNHWFSSKLLQEKLGIKSDDEVRMSTLDEAVKWANANPFRQIKVLVNDLANEPGKADLIVGVEERIPLRFTASFDDTGNAIIGNRHYTGSLQFGNLWGLDHQGSYQYTTTDHQGVFQSHSADYRIPLPWRHYLQFGAGYIKVKPTFNAGAFTQTGENVVANMRYTIPLRGGDSPSEFSAGIDFKEGNNNLVYNLASGPVPVFANKTEVIQATAAFSTVHRDKQGAWLFGTNFSASPGNLTSLNTEKAFRAARYNPNATYLIGSLSLQRLQNLDRGWSIYMRGLAQGSTGRIPGSEQLSIGGSATVRGYDERIYAADQGFIVSNDLQAPVIKSALPFMAKSHPPLETRFILFYDAAQIFYNNRDLSDAPLHTLASTGVGVRLNLPVNFSLSADYGWQIAHLSYLPASRSRGHIKVVLAF